MPRHCGIAHAEEVGDRDGVGGKVSRGVAVGADAGRLDIKARAGI